MPRSLKSTATRAWACSIVSILPSNLICLSVRPPQRVSPQQEFVSHLLVGSQSADRTELRRRGRGRALELRADHLLEFEATPASVAEPLLVQHRQHRCLAKKKSQRSTWAATLGEKETLGILDA